MLTVIVCSVLMVSAAGDTPRMEDVVRSPADYAGRTLTFDGATLSGSITKYDIAGIRKYYLNVSSKAHTFEPGFFLAPPDLADKLGAKLNSEKNYGVRLTCKVARLVINEVPQWHGIVTQVDLVDGDGKVTETIKQATK